MLREPELERTSRCRYALRSPFLARSATNRGPSGAWSSDLDPILVVSAHFLRMLHGPLARALQAAVEDGPQSRRSTPNAQRGTSRVRHCCVVETSLRQLMTPSIEAPLRLYGRAVGRLAEGHELEGSSSSSLRQKRVVTISVTHRTSLGPSGQKTAAGPSSPAT